MSITRKFNINVGVRRILCVVLLSSIGFCAMAQWSHFITNYSHGTKGAQTWQIALYNDNWVYFANRNGVLQFDGDNWSDFHVTNGLDVRSVYVSRDEGRIYAGGINEYGYFQPDEHGVMKYTRLNKTFKKSEFLNNIWGIFEANHIIYAQGDTRVLRQEGNKVTVVETHMKLDCTNLINEVLYIGGETGLYMLVGRRIIPANGAEALSGKRIRGIFPYREGMLVVTAYNGIYFYDGNVAKKLNTGLEAFMTGNEVFCAAVFGDKIAVGTVQKGVAIYNISDGSVDFYDESNGLQNNTVISLAFDSRGNLWAGLDSGIDYIWLDLPLTCLSSYQHSIGSGYAAALSGNMLYLGTNRGLFLTPYLSSPSSTAGDINFVPQSGGQVWGLERAGNDLFCLHDRGLFLVKGTQLQRIGNCVGVWSLQPMADCSGRYFVGCYDGLFVLENINGAWTITKRVGNLFESLYNYVQSSPDELWVRSDGNGVLYVKIDLATMTAVNKKMYGIASGFPSILHVDVSKVGNKVLFSTVKGIYTYDKKSDRIVYDAAINGKLSGDIEYSHLLEHNGYILGLSHNQIIRTKVSGNSPAEVIPMLPSKIEQLRGWETIYPISDSVYVLPNYYGFAFLDFSAKRSRSLSRNLAFISSVLISYPKDSVIYTGNYLKRKYVPEIPYSLNSLRFEYGTSNIMETGTVQYQCRLKGQEGWSDYTTSLTKEYTNLTEGKYTFEVRAVSSNGIENTDEFTFRILPPWYRSWWAYCFYLLVIVAAARYALYLESSRVERKKEIVAREKDNLLSQQQKEFEREAEQKEHQILELEQEKLRNELDHKSQEMANLLLNFSRKNEALTMIKEELMKIYAKLKISSTSTEAKQMLVTLNSQIDTNMQSDDLLKRIEDQFDLVHNGFTKKLRAAYPELTQKELLMCVYLRMDLSTKEIAPLLNISVRGVETMRYRIRKKFDIDREANLFDFLSKFSD